MSGEANVAAFRRLMKEGFGGGDLHVVDEVVDAALVEHQSGIRPQNREGVKNAIRSLRTAFPDLHYTFEQITCDGDTVWGHMTARGTHLGAFGPLPASGKRFAIDVIDIARFENGRIVEHWGVPDRFALLEQLGMLEQQRQSTAA